MPNPDTSPLRATSSFPDGAPQRESYDTDDAHNLACAKYERERDVGPLTGPFPTLTNREREVALLLVRGHKNREIADALGLSVKTVDTHRGHILKKSNVRNNVELARLAFRNDWAEPAAELENGVA